MKKIFFLFIYSFLLTKLFAQTQSLYVPTKLRDKIDALNLSPNGKTLIINNTHVIKFNESLKKFKEFHNNPIGVSSHFLNNDEILWVRNRWDENPLYVSSIVKENFSKIPNNDLLNEIRDHESMTQNYFNLIDNKSFSYSLSNKLMIIDLTGDSLSLSYLLPINETYGKIIPSFSINKVFLSVEKNIEPIVKVYDKNSKKELLSKEFRKISTSHFFDSKNLNLISNYNELGQCGKRKSGILFEDLKIDKIDTILFSHKDGNLYDISIIDRYIIAFPSQTGVCEEYGFPNDIVYIINIDTKRIERKINLGKNITRGALTLLDFESNQFSKKIYFTWTKVNNDNYPNDRPNCLIKINLEKFEIKELPIQFLSTVDHYEPSNFLINEESNTLFCKHEELISCYNLTTGKPILSITILKIKNDENLILYMIPNTNYYHVSSKNSIKQLYFLDDNLRMIGFEQLDPVYNRPDIVLDSIGKYFGNSDGGMIKEYRKSWEKRIDHLGLDKEKLGKGEIAVPDAEILNADNIAYENKEGKLTISIKANDTKYSLRRFNVHVNEVPLYGSAGISIAHLKKQVWDTTVSVPLSIGENKIQVSVMNEIGLENFKYPTYVNYTPEKEIVAKTHYIGIGVNDFKEAGHNLKYCVDDVTDLAEAFKSKSTVTKLFKNQNVTRENILKLKQYLKDSTTINDKVIISCSSHGLLDDSLNFYLATHDVDFSNPKARGLKYEELEDLLDGIPARQKLLLLDACNSGENDKTELLKKELNRNKTTMDSAQVLASRGVIIKLEEENKNNFKKMNELFVNVRNNTGSVIISAAGGQESALEAIEVNGKKIENGAFTYSVLEYLKANEGKTEVLSVNKLKQYVEQRVEEITNGKQKPTSRQETMEVDWRVR